jgi:molybdopterin converting factor small subunit
MEVQLFGIIAERAGADSISLEARSLRELRGLLEQRIPGLADLSHAVAVDRRIIHGELDLNGSEEIAVLPPFAGG